MPGKTPTLSELYRLAEQLELDRELAVAVARERDHALGADSKGLDDTGRLLFWLRAISAQRPGVQGVENPWITESSAVALGRILALFFGFSGMATFLLASGRGLVNVFMFLLLFVLVQLLLCLVALFVLARASGGQSAALVLPLNPVRLLVTRALPDRRYLREAQSVLRLVLLRFGQELGALFTIGAIAAFFVVLTLSDFTFVWGSTFQLSDSFVEQMTSALAAPWAGWLPAATVSGDLIFASRFHPAISSLSPVDVESMRGWWPFLIMCMVCYALLPRLLLWLGSKLCYGRQMRRACTQLPGAGQVLARMKAPLVHTQGQSDTGRRSAVAIASSVDPALLLINWANALTPEDLARFEEFAPVANGNVVNAGLGSPPVDLERLADKLATPVTQLYVAVKAWEPPMADLADFLGHCATTLRCTLFLVPLSGKPLTAGRLSDWQVFTRGLAFGVVDVQVLGRE